MNVIDILTLLVVGVVILCSSLCLILKAIDIHLMSYVYLFVGKNLIRLNSFLIERFNYFKLHRVNLGIVDFLFHKIQHKGSTHVFHVIRSVLPAYHSLDIEDIPVGMFYASKFESLESLVVVTKDELNEDNTTMMSLFHDRKKPYLETSRSNWISPYLKGHRYSARWFTTEAIHRLDSDNKKGE